MEISQTIKNQFDYYVCQRTYRNWQLRETRVHAEIQHISIKKGANNGKRYFQQ